MPNVSIETPNFNRLQKLAIPLVDDINTVLARLLDFYEQHHHETTSTNAEPAPELTRTYPADSPPDLTYTTIKEIKLDGKVFKNRYWNPLMFAVINMAAEKIGKEKMMAVLEGNTSAKELQGYKHIPAAGIYVQGRESNLCWRMIARMAKLANLPVEVDFYWQDQPTAAHPNQSGRFVVEAA